MGFETTTNHSFIERLLHSASITSKHHRNRSNVFVMKVHWRRTHRKEVLRNTTDFPSVRCTFFGGERLTAMKGPAHTKSQSEPPRTNRNGGHWRRGIRERYGEESRRTDADDDEVRLQRYSSTRIRSKVDTKNDSTADCSSKFVSMIRWEEEC